MNASRRNWLTGLAAAILTLPAWHAPALADDHQSRVIELRIENRHVVADKKTIRITEGETVELHWTSDQAVELHLHGYDLKAAPAPAKPAVMAFKAYAATWTR